MNFVLFAVHIAQAQVTNPENVQKKVFTLFKICMNAKFCTIIHIVMHDFLVLRYHYLKHMF